MPRASRNRTLVPLLLTLGVTAHFAYTTAGKRREAAALPRLRILRAAPGGQPLLPPSQAALSPNWSEREYGPIDTIVLHCTAGSTTRGAITHFQDPHSQASSQVVIPDRGLPGEPGQTVRVVADARKSWSVRREVSFQGRGDVNSRALSIEIVNTALEGDPYSDWQLEETVRWCRYWMGRYPIRYLVTHSYLDPGRRRDPCVTFPWETFLARTTGDLFEDPTRIHFTLNGKSLSGTGRLRGSESWGPLRLLLEQLGYRVTYDHRQQTLEIHR